MALVNDFGQSKVTVKKDELLAKMTANRETHKAEFAETYATYRVAAAIRLEQEMHKAKAGKPFTHFIDLDVPSEHTKDYDRVIAMLEMSTADEISVTESQFSQYVLDEWNWKSSFNTSKMNYSNAVT